MEEKSFHDEFANWMTVHMRPSQASTLGWKVGAHHPQSFTMETMVVGKNESLVIAAVIENGKPVLIAKRFTGRPETKGTNDAAIAKWKSENQITD